MEDQSVRMIEPLARVGIPVVRYAPGCWPTILAPAPRR